MRYRRFRRPLPLDPRHSSLGARRMSHHSPLAFLGPEFRTAHLGCEMSRPRAGGQRAGGYRQEAGI